jgi:hypothetical protein
LLARYLFFFYNIIFEFINLQFVNAQTNSSLILENEAFESNSQEWPKIAVSIEGTPSDDELRAVDGNDELDGGIGNDII